MIYASSSSRVHEMQVQMRRQETWKPKNAHPTRCNVCPTSHSYLVRGPVRPYTTHTRISGQGVVYHHHPAIVTPDTINAAITTLAIAVAPRLAAPCASMKDTFLAVARMSSLITPVAAHSLI